MNGLSKTGLAVRRVFRRGRAKICDMRLILGVRHKECLRSVRRHFRPRSRSFRRIHDNKFVY